MKKALILLLAICLVTLSFKCEDDYSPKNQEEDKKALDILKSEIETLSSQSVCNDNYMCKYMALGSKPCGGPWSYLIYSTSIDTQKLENLVSQYNKKEQEYNENYKVSSDCAMVLPPSQIDCENNRCIAVY
ncbi:hypothetical protein [Gaetbulibacter saemankumensis]|uniref:hypothetical protein n=1 Tax=Gaetbulibacter saemankumensis TaxID=311208 RepID=UPI00047FA447|nr:hypothetical protein [Gaetbulibacter saemankumensis]